MELKYNFLFILLSIAFKSIGAVASKYAAITISGALILGIIEAVARTHLHMNDQIDASTLYLLCIEAINHYA